MHVEYRNWVRVLILLACAGAGAGVQAGEDEARVWLERMTHALQHRNYEGVFVYQNNGELESSYIVHAAGEAGERERVKSLNGVAREVVRDQHKVTCILPDQRSVMVEKSHPRKPFPISLPENIATLGAFYQFMQIGTDRVADRPARVIAVMPRDEYRFGYRLWLDEESSLPLKIESLDHTGAVVERMMFTAFSLPETVPVERTRPSLPQEGFAWLEGEDVVEPPETDPGQWAVADLPDGFRLVGRMEHYMPDRDEPVEHLIFSDGLASVSVYIERPAAPEHAGLQGGTRMGAVSAYGTAVSGYHVTVMGEVPERTVEVIGRSIQPRTAAARP